eukprot:15443154-Alexandrium_andersonii.AAC.1
MAGQPEFPTPTRNRRDTVDILGAFRQRLRGEAKPRHKSPCWRTLANSAAPGGRWPLEGS